MNKISLSAAIGVIKELSERKNIGDHYKIILGEIAEYLSQQLNNGWIPVSTGKMPEFDTNCLVTADNGEVWTSKFYGYGEECQGYREYPDGVWEINQCELNVIAWQPLPEPYKEVSDAERN